MKKILICGLILILFFSFANVSASEITNDTVNLISTENDNQIIESTYSMDLINQDNRTEDLTEIDDSLVNEENKIYESIKIADSNNQLKDRDMLSASSSEDVGYRAFIRNTTITYGSSNLIYISLDSPSGYVLQPSTYSYNFYLKIYDEFGNLLKTSDQYSGTGQGLTTLYWIVNSVEIDKTGDSFLRRYRVDLISSNRVITSGNLFISHSSNYHVKVDLSDSIIKKSNGAEITMTVTQYNTVHKYDFYLKVYDSKGNLKINKKYYNANCGSVETLYYTIKPNELPVDTYTIKIDGADYICESNKLQVLYDDLGYKVILNDNYIDYGKTNTIRFNVFKDNDNPASYYDFFVYIYNSKNKMIIQKTCRASQWGAVSINLDTTKLNVDNYTIQIKSTNGAYILATAKLIVTNSLNYKYITSISGTTMTYGSDGNLNLNIFPAYSGNYNYDFYLFIYDSNWNQIIKERYSNTSSSKCVESYNFNPISLKSGNYTIQLRDVSNNSPNIYSKLIVKPKSSSEYSVSILSDVTIKSGNNGLITMSVSPTKTNFNYRYDFYLKVYDSYNREKFSKRFNKVEYSSCNVYASVGYDFEPGTYTIKLIDSEGNFVMDAAKLIVMSLSHSDYSVSVSDTYIRYFNPSSYFIDMSIIPASSGYYLYDFYLKVYDFNNTEKISQRYYSSKADTQKSYYINFDMLEPGSYTIKLLNNGDNYVMSTATLIIDTTPNYTYSVNVKDINMSYGSNESIEMSISIKNNYFYNYDFYLKVYDSNDVEKISKRYFSTYSKYYETYDLSAMCLDIGNYTVKILNTLDNHIMSTANLIVNKMSTKLISSDITMDYGSNKYLIVNLVDQYNQLISGEKVSIDIGSAKTLTTDSNGQVKLSINDLSPNTYYVTIGFDGTDNYEKSSISTKIIVNKLKASLSSSDINVIYNTDKYLIATLNDNNNPLSKYNLLVNLNGVKSFSTDSNGQIKVTTKRLVPKTYSAIITFGGNSIYDKITKSVKVIVKKATPKITAKAKTFKKSVKTKKYSITLKNHLNKVMKNTKVTIKINKKTYSSKTNSKGVATFKITKLTKKGTFKSVINYKGDKYYNKVTKKVNIKIK